MAATGRPWTQPIGFKHALFEVVADVVSRAEDLDDADAIAAAIKATDINTVVGAVNWSNGPVPNVSKTPLVSGQWQKAGDGVDLVITNNAQYPDIPVGGDLQLLGQARQVSALLSVAGLSKSFGAVAVAQDTSFDVAPGAAVGVIGPNGAGKTSLFHLITGVLRPDGGRILFDGVDVTHSSAAARCKQGIARSFQVPQPFGGMTVFENALVGATQGAGLSARDAQEHALQVLEETGLMDKANTRAGALSLLDRKRLELTRALSAKPKLLLLDEIAGGLTEAECHALVDTIQTIHKRGTTIIWIEHVVHALLAVVEHLIVIDFGRMIAEGEPRAIMESPEVKEIYLGVDPDV